MIAWRRIPLAGALAALAASWSAGAAADAISDAFKQIAGDTFISRDVTLSELGFTQPMVMNGSDAAREIYLPVPAGLPLSDAFLQLDGKYLRTDGGRTTILLSVDGHPVAARSPTDERGVLRIGLGIDGTPRPSGLVRVGVSWSSYHARQTCDEKSIGNSYEISDQSQLTFRYDGSAVRDLATAWTALPAAPGPAGGKSHPVGGILRRRLAHRPGAAPGRQEPGDSVPPRRRRDCRPARHHRAGRPGVAAGFRRAGHRRDLYAAQRCRNRRAPAVAQRRDPARRHGRRQCADQPAQCRARCAGRAAPHDCVRRRRMPSRSGATATSASPAKLDADAVQLVTVANRPVIAVAPPAAAKAAVLFDVLWRQTPIVPAVLVRTADRPRIDTAIVSLSRLGGSAANFEVLERSDWTAAFDLGVLGPGGRLPVELVIDVAVAPSPSTTPPVVSVFLNDYLLGARRVDIADGQRLRISARIPRYALDSRNSCASPCSVNRCATVAARTRRPIRRPSCRAAISASRPASRAATTSWALLPRMADKAQIIVPPGLPDDAPASLPRVIETRRCQRRVARPGQAHGLGQRAGEAGRHFPRSRRLDRGHQAEGDGGRRPPEAGDSDRTLFDVSGLDRIGVIGACVGGRPGSASPTARSVATRPTSRCRFACRAATS